MEVIMYYNLSDDRAINKSLSSAHTFNGELRDEINVMYPIIRFENDEVLRYNYAYIPSLQRYYSIKEMTCYRQGIWDVSFEVDVLMSFKNDILQLTAVVDKQSEVNIGNEYIDDSSLVTENIMFKTVYNFSSGFNDTGEYILITAG